MNSAEHLSDSMAEINKAMARVRRNIKVDKNYVRRLLRMLGEVEDFRQVGKTKYRLENILCICLLLSLKGQFTSFHGAARYIEAKASYFRRRGLIKGKQIPSHDTLRNIFMRLDAKQLRDAILGRARKMIKKITGNAKGEDSGKMRLLSGDGKAFKGSGRRVGSTLERRNTNVFNLFDASDGVCLSSIALDDKDSEIPTLQALLRVLNLKNTMVTGDALHCQTKTMEIIVERGGHYTLTVKENQPSKKAHIIDMMRLNRKKVKRFWHNKCEYRVLVIDWKLTDEDFPHAGAYVMMVSHKRSDQANYKPQAQYFVSSSNNPLLVAETIDNRWSIENDLHGFKDGFNKEDSCTFMDKNAIEVMAVFNNIAYTFYSLALAIFGHKDMCETKICYQDRPEKMLKKLLPLMDGWTLTNLLKSDKKGRKKVAA